MLLTDKKSLNRFKSATFLRSVAYARRSQDPELMKVVIERYKTGDYRSKSDDNLTVYTMDYYRYSKNYEAFKRLAEQYIDSLMNQKTIKKLRKKTVSIINFIPKIKSLEKIRLLISCYKNIKKVEMLTIL